MERDKWDYKIFLLNPAHSSEEMETALNDLGQDGWEAVCAIHGTRLILKRKKDSSFPVDNDPEPGIPAICQ